MNAPKWTLSVVAGALVIAASGLAAPTLLSTPSGNADDWPYYGHDAGGMRYSRLAQITRQNVGRLKPAWVYHTEDAAPGDARARRTGFESTPLVVDGTLYLTTPFNRIVALDPETGVERWTFDPAIDRAADYGDGLINRGLATWVDRAARVSAPCRRRLFEATLDARLVAVDAATGLRCQQFGERGEVSLRNVSGFEAGIYHMTSPPAVIDDVVVIGSAVNDNNRARMPSGVVRAFDVRSGAQRWAWDPIPSTATETGAANAWSIMAVDAQRHLVFVPTGAASPDYYGGSRPGNNTWANSVVALRAKTGDVAWGFQLVHHDLWDYDTASPPLLATVTDHGRQRAVVVQGNKTGFLFVLDRETGRPVFPVEERPVPKSDVPGEIASTTQPFPTAPPPIVPQRLSVDDMWGMTPADRDACVAQFRTLRNEGLFTPPALQGSVVMPGMLGGMNWSGSAFDPDRGLLIVNANILPAAAKLIPRAEFDDRSRRNEDGEYAAQEGTPYGLFRRFLRAPSGLPCNRPPWGTLTAIDLGAGTIRWQVPLGSLQGLMRGGQIQVPPGSVSLGGPIVTGGGLVFIAGTIDARLRAFDIETGRELWAGELPASGHATPVTYQPRSTGKQYVVVAAGGHAKITEENVGDALIAFTLDK